MSTLLSKGEIEPHVWFCGLRELPIKGFWCVVWDRGTPVLLEPHPSPHSSDGGWMGLGSRPEVCHPCCQGIRSGYLLVT